MRRILITLVMSGAVLVAAPGGAMAAHHHAHHHASHKARHHRSTRRHSRIRHERIGRTDQDQGGNSSGQAGTVTSFDNGVLTITLNDGSTVSGTVTDGTELECMAPSSNPQSEDGDSGGDNNPSGGDNNPSGDDNNNGDDNGDNNNGDDNGDNGDNGGQMCSTSSLTPGTPVAEANLEITSSGATWDKVELITS
jgi:hypothetical protein